jgi:hypothetical protein
VGPRTLGIDGAAAGRASDTGGEAVSVATGAPVGEEPLEASPAVTVAAVAVVDTRRKATRAVRTCTTASG